MEWRTARLACVLAAAAALATGCGSHASPSPPPDVYVAGWESNGTVIVARLWKNGEATSLSDGVRDGVATGVAVDGQDVYVSGFLENADGSHVATYWKNGTPVALSDGTGDARAWAIAVQDGDVYVVGRRMLGNKAVPTLWKNGAPTSLSERSGEADAFGLAISGGDVYVAGFEVAITGTPEGFVVAPVAMLWKNGVATALTDGHTAALAASVAVAGGNVFVCGRVLRDSVYVATLWKDGVPASLTDGTYDAVTSGIAVDEGGAVVVSGGESDGKLDVAKLWREGSPIDLTWSGPDGIDDATALAVTVSGADVYAAGHHGVEATYWKNGEEIALTGRSAHAQGLAVAVVRH